MSANGRIIQAIVKTIRKIKLPMERRLYPRYVSWLGLGGCLFLTPFLPPRIWITGTAMIAAGLVGRLIARRVWPRLD